MDVFGSTALILGIFISGRKSKSFPYGLYKVENLVAVAAIVPVPLIFGTYEMKVGEKFSSPSLVADGRQFRADVLTELVVFAALAGQWFGLPLDRVAAAAIALLIVKAGWEILVSGMRVLLDASIDPATMRKIEDAIEANPEVSVVEEVTGETRAAIYSSRRRSPSGSQTWRGPIKRASGSSGTSGRRSRTSTGP